MKRTGNKPFMYEAARILADKLGSGAVNHCFQRLEEAAEADDFVGVRNWVELTLTVVQIVHRGSRAIGMVGRGAPRTGHNR